MTSRPLALAAVGVALAVAGCAGNTRATTPGYEAAVREDGPHRFIDVAADVGLDFRHGAFNWEAGADPVAMMGGGLCWLDFDRDGWMDLYVVNSYAESEWGRWQDAGGLPRNALFHNDGGSFADVSAGSGADLEVRGNGCVAADFDGDGWTDLYVTSARFNALLWNDGDGTFTEGAEAAGVDVYQWQAGAAAGDLNGDGRMDLVLAGYVDLNNRIEEATTGFPNTQFPLPDLVFLNEEGEDGRPVFREVGSEVGLNSEGDEYGLAVVLTDVDRDGDLDVYMVNDTQPNRLYINEPSGAVGFRLVERQDAGADDDNAGMGVTSGDMNGDGRFDLFVSTHYGQPHAGYRNVSDLTAPRFEDLIPSFDVEDFGMEHTGWGTNWFDADNDGDLDLAIAYGHIPVLDLDTDREPLQLLVNTGTDAPRFEDASADLGLASVPDRIWRGSALADYDNDGDLDLAVVPIAERLILLENVAPQGNWIVLVADPYEPGTVLTVSTGDRRLLREVIAGSSWLSSDDPRFVVGIGSASEVQVTVTWPDCTEKGRTIQAGTAGIIERDGG